MAATPLDNIETNVENMGVFLNEKKNDGMQTMKINDLVRKRRHSRYLITVNTNKRPSTNAEYAKTLARALSDAANKFGKEGIRTCILFNYSTDCWSSQFIKKVEFKYSIEVGHHPKGGRVHLHGLLDIFHYSNVQIDCSAVNRFFTNILVNDDLFGLHLSSIYVNVKWKTTDDLLEMYLTKNEFHDVSDNSSSILKKFDME
jgi:hypothetical protein